MKRFNIQRKTMWMKPVRCSLYTRDQSSCTMYDFCILLTRKLYSNKLLNEIHLILKHGICLLLPIEWAFVCSRLFNEIWFKSISSKQHSFPFFVHNPIYEYMQLINTHSNNSDNLVFHWCSSCSTLNVQSRLFSCVPCFFHSLSRTLCVNVALTSIESWMARVRNYIRFWVLRDGIQNESKAKT